MRHYYTTIKIAKTSEAENIKCWQGCRGSKIFTHCQWGCNKMAHLASEKF